MKNNRLSKKEVQELREVVKRINSLADMEHCSFHDQVFITHSDFRHYLEWFIVEAAKIERIIEQE